MKQVLQSLKDGSTVVEDVPCPQAGDGELLVQTSYSLISSGTEKMLVDFGRAGPLAKARQQPEKVRMVLDKVKTDGLIPTIESVRNKLDQPLAMGYCNVGRVISVGRGVSEYEVGDRVVSNGKHAEVIAVPKNLCAKIPEAVTDEEAVFTVIGAIALQGIRLTAPTLGEAVVVTGLGLIGLIAVQLLKANGCRVLGIDFDQDKLAMARSLGAEVVDLAAGENPVDAAMAFSRGRGVDAVLITASTKSNEPVQQAARMSRKRGRIVLVGVTGLELSRADFYEKELSFQVSCSYGPGRYDENYEQQGNDYPLAFVRWTEQRNFEAVLDMLADKRLNTKALVSHRFSIEQAEQAYQLVSSNEKSLGILLTYPNVGNDSLQAPTVRLIDSHEPSAGSSSKAVVGFIGAGSYAGKILIPAFKKAGAQLHSVISKTGVSSVHAGKKFGFAHAATDVSTVLDNPAINTVVITTRHDMHAGLVCDALAAGKNVFVEKPLAMTSVELAKIEQAYTNVGQLEQQPVLMVGFNRRFAPHTIAAKKLLLPLNEPKTMVMTVNAGSISADHWIQHPQKGGGRIIGECCHFIDLLRYMAGFPIVSIQSVCMGAAPGVSIRDDKVTFTLGFADGSFGTVHYFANGHNAFPKERLEVFCAGRIVTIDNFRRMRAYGWPGFSRKNLLRQDKGNYACAKAFVDSVQSNKRDKLIPFAELLEVSQSTFNIMQQLQE